MRFARRGVPVPAPLPPLFTGVKNLQAVVLVLTWCVRATDQVDHYNEHDKYTFSAFSDLAAQVLCRHGRMEPSANHAVVVVCVLS